MTATTFDTLAYARKLESVGFSREQAEAQAEAFRSFAETQSDKARQELATKSDIAELNARIRELELRLKYDLTVRLGGIVVACTAILLAGLPLILK